ncbi:MAG: transcription-repair coupling factor [Labilithrix sp.]|nr:transcription-repair coupling factor [Labilithrix sp.]MCW5810579.1 transcription-repair coupling factor [Labilithrix sp.]
MHAEAETELDPLPSVLPPEGVEVTRLAAIAARTDARVDVAGVRGAADAVLVAALARGPAPIVVVAEDGEDAARLASDVAFLSRTKGEEDDVLVLALPEASPYADVNPDRRAAMARMATLAHLATARPWRVLVVPPAALVRKLVPPGVLRATTHHVAKEAELDRDRLVRDLLDAGWLRVPVVEDPGSFAVRGSILDVWPPGSADPIRIELYGDLVESLKPFDPNTQTTIKEPLAEVWLPPARDAILTKEHVERAKRRVGHLADMIDWPTTKTRLLVDDVATGRAFFGADGFLPAYYEELAPLAAYVPADARFVLAAPAALTADVRAELERAAEDAAVKAETPSFILGAHYLTEEEGAAALARRSVVALHATPIAGAPGEGFAQWETTSHALSLAAQDNEDLTRAVKAARAQKGKSNALAPVARRVLHYKDQGLRVFLTARAETQAERLCALLSHQGVRCKVQPSLAAAPADADAEVVVGPLTRGVLLPGEGLALVTEEEIFGGRAHRVARRKVADKTRPFVEDLRSLNVGDYVVHVEHGIGRYEGLVHRDVGGLTVDLLVVAYAGGDKLYLPVYRLNQIQKFSGAEAGEPKIDRLGGASFAKTKSKVRAAVRQMADELLRLYAERQSQLGDALDAADDEYRAFEATFQFDETDDQARAIDEVNKDLEIPRPMDRLVCGDVGFGKTEVAIRAAFRVAHAGKQVAVLCPTTVLAQQHFRTFEARMRDYPINLKVLSRFQTKKESDEVLAGLKDGKVDVVIGTHRLLSKDIHFKSLGLLVVDEEQRFGVAHKERIKQMRVNVDVLTLSATPIPRTLQMAVAGIRDLSLITTPPVDRRAVRTLVTAYDEQVLKEAIGRELHRGGQVFYVYNRVEGLYEKANVVQRLFPNARIGVVHGQMALKKGPRSQQIEGQSESALEKTMLDFVEGRYDILCATAIIESGLDIPRANTIIIDRADLFGLAQLYQLRGRVGRSKERAYCYLVVPPPSAMNDEARARIEALERHTELGSGFKIASLDLELRGAGDILGAEQSGNIASVGLDLFAQMLDEAVHELRGEPVVHDVDPELSFDVTALLPDDYVGDVGVRLSIYKRLASAIDEAEVGQIAIEMEDRFGPPPSEAKCLVRLMTLKCELRKLKVLGCEATARAVTLHLRDDTPLDPQKVLAFVKEKHTPYKITPDMRLTRRFGGENDGLVNAEEMLVELSRCWRD